MEWNVLLHHDFDVELNELSDEVQETLAAVSLLLKEYGPQLGRPYVDTLNGSRHSNMKEIRFDVLGGVWRVAFAFDPKRRAILLVAGNKAGVKQDPFYKRLIGIADKRFSDWIEQL